MNYFKPMHIPIVQQAIYFWQFVGHLRDVEWKTIKDWELQQAKYHQDLVLIFERWRIFQDSQNSNFNDVSFIQWYDGMVTTIFNHIP